MNVQFAIEFTEEHVKYACRRWFARYIGVGFPIMVLFLGVLIAGELMVGKTDWMFGALVVVFVMAVGINVAIYFRRINAAVSQLRKTEGATVAFEFSDERFKASSSMGSTELKWEAFKELWIFPKVWLLMLNRAIYLSLPADQLNEDVKRFLKQKIAALGGKIK